MTLKVFFVCGPVVTGLERNDLWPGPDATKRPVAWIPVVAVPRSAIRSGLPSGVGGGRGTRRCRPTAPGAHSPGLGTAERGTPTARPDQQGTTMASSLTKASATPGTPGSEKTFFGHPPAAWPPSS
ncbi:hypothetical protein GCM10020256_46670 [Streptomyces thermocoprophilus]